MKRALKWLIPVLTLAGIVFGFFTYTGIYYHTDKSVLGTLNSSETVTVEKTNYGYYFDGPSEDDLLVFYPGAKVEETAYAPLLHLLAESGMDVCLVRMPLRLAIFGKDKINGILPLYEHTNVYIGGHSLGGAMAADYAAKNAEKLSGVILLAAYPTKQIDEKLTVLSIYGSEDGVLKKDKVIEGRKYVTANYYEFVIEGGNHAMFGNYGAQSGDGKATISDGEQQRLTVEYIIENIKA